LKSNSLKYIQKNVKQDFAKDIFPKMANAEKLYAYNTAEYLKDVGTPERLKRVTEDFLSGKIAKLNSNNVRPAIFLDRDGVINEASGLINNANDFRLLPDVENALIAINESDYLAIVITNQPVIARNICTFEELKKIHNKMDTLLGKKGAKIDALYYCPHHPDKGYPEENVEYKIDCNCRKPKTGMIARATEDFNIDLSKSFIIGDSFRDIECGKNAGITTVGVETGRACKDKPCKPDYIFKDLREAVEFILKNKTNQ